MPNYTYEKSSLKVDGTEYAAASIFQDGIEHLRMTRFDGPPDDFPRYSVYGDQCMDLTKLGAETIREVRRVLEAGPTNNKMFDEGFLFGQDLTLAYSLNVMVEAIWDELKDKKPMTAKYRPLWDAATYAAACRKGLGGVCAAISWVTMAIISQRGFNLMACVYYNAGSDHSYVLIRKRETPWFVVDPWVREPRLCPWRYNYFGASGGNTHYFQIMHPVEIALGQPIPEELLEQACSKAKLIGYREPHKRKVWAHTTNVDPSKASLYPPVCGPDEWGSRVSPQFRVEWLWA